MRAYLPLTVPELAGDHPPSREPLALEERLAEAEMDSEELSVSIIDDASVESLVLAQRQETPPFRLVACGTLEPGQHHFASWANIDCIFADEKSSLALAVKALGAPDQETTDQGMQELFAKALLWYDISEREMLASHLEVASGT